MDFLFVGALTLVLLLDKEVVNGGLQKSFLRMEGGLLVFLDDLPKLML